MLPDKDEEIDCEDCLYWDDNAEECSLYKELDDDGNCDDYT